MKNIFWEMGDLAPVTRTINVLDQDVSLILDNFGTDFKLAF